MSGEDRGQDETTAVGPNLLGSALLSAYFGGAKPQGASGLVGIKAELEARVGKP